MTSATAFQLASGPHAFQREVEGSTLQLVVRSVEEGDDGRSLTKVSPSICEYVALASQLLGS